MAPKHCDGPCFAPPHPDLLRRTRQEILKAQGTPNESVLKAKAQRLMQADRRIPGMNDGTIFPPSHFKEKTSIMKMSTAALERAPLRGQLRAAVVLVEFQDVKMTAGTKERMQDRFFSTGKIPTGSVNEFYQEVSNHKVSFTGEVVGPFTLAHDMAYYANGQSGMGWPEPNAMTMADEAVQLATGSMDFAPYDNDGNGYVDAFIVVHAGGDASETGSKNDIWSLKWNIPQERELNGVKIYAFLTVGEYALTGVCAHEIGHLVFGWPDLYDTDYSSRGIGSWCLMSFGSWGYGGNRPCHPSAWCKANQGWIDTVVETENHSITLQDVKSGYKTHRLWTNGDTTSQEYFLIENRQLTGFDESLPGAGLLVWHVDDSLWGNTDENHPKIKLLQADGRDDLLTNFDTGDAGDPFPGLSNNTTFNAISNPSSKAYSGQDTYVSVTKIPTPATNIAFDITVKPIDHPAGDFDPNTWYRLKNTYAPASHSLEVLTGSGRIEMSRDGNFWGQFWQIKSNGDGTYHLRTLYTGATRRLDIDGSDKTKVVIADAGLFSGQFWIIKPWGDGSWHLENAFTGPDRYLDTLEGGPKAWMNQANIGRPTERWTITPIRSITESGF